MERTWRTKVHEVISALCTESYEKANRLLNGQLRKKHVPYAVPELADKLVKALGRDDEVDCKSLMLWDYESPTNKGKKK